MALTKASIQSRVAAFVAHANTPQSIKDYLQAFLDRDKRLGQDPATVDAKVDTYLDTDPASLDEAKLNRALNWAMDRWDSLP